MTAAELKAAILDLAVRGQLVPQDPKDKPADKPSDVDDPPYELPRNWVWKKIPQVAWFQEGPGIGKKDFRDKGVPLIRIAGMQGSVVSLAGCNFLDPKMVAEKWSHFRLDEGDTVISTSASLDKIAIVGKDCRGAIPYTGLIRFKMGPSLNREYFNWFIQSPVYAKQIDQQKKGDAIKHYGPTHLKKMLMALPPLAEQKRIVAKIEELLPLVEEYGAAQKELEALNADFPAALRESILQDAVQGKLTAEWRKSHRGESAADLLAQIAAERAAGGRARTPAAPRKKEKPLPPITDDEKPFEIPDTWAWCRLGEIGITQTGSTPSTKNKAFYGKDIPFIKPADIYDDHIDYENCGLSFAGAAAGRVIAENSILMVCIGTIGKTYFTDRKVSCNQQINAITPFGIDVRFLLIAMQSPYFQMTAWDESSSTTLSILNKSTWSNIAIPLPPFAEQKAIVERVDELLKIVDAMKA